MTRPAKGAICPSTPGRFARFTIAGAVASTLLAASPARAQAPLWPDAPWRAFVTGNYPQGFIPISLAAGDLDGDGDLDVLVGQFFFGGPGVSVLEEPRGRHLPATGLLRVGAGPVRGRGCAGRLRWGRRPGRLCDHSRRERRPGQAARLAEQRRRHAGRARRVHDRIRPRSASSSPTSRATASRTWRPPTTPSARGPSPSSSTTGRPAPAPVSCPKRTSRWGCASRIWPPTTSTATATWIWRWAGSRTHNVTYVSILVNDGTGVFAAPVAYEAAPGGFPTARTRVALRDLDNDGDADLISGGLYEDGSVTAGAITIRRNDGQGSFGAHEAYLLGNYVSDPWSLATADLNGDGFADVIASTPSGRAIRRLRGPALERDGLVRRARLLRGGAVDLRRRRVRRRRRRRRGRRDRRGVLGGADRPREPGQRQLPHPDPLPARPNERRGRERGHRQRRRRRHRDQQRGQHRFQRRRDHGAEEQRRRHVRSSGTPTPTRPRGTSATSSCAT